MNVDSKVLWEVLPESKALLKQRLKMLHYVSTRGVAGRRIISQDLGISERKVRNEIQVLEEMGLLKQKESGITITPKGLRISEEFEEFLLQVDARSALTSKLLEVLKIKKVILAETKDGSPMPLAVAGVRELERMLKEAKVLGLTGGSSVAHIVEAFPKKRYENLEVVAARGSIGSMPEHQANTLGAMLSTKLGSNFYPLFTPDVLNSSTVDSLMREPIIVKTMERINTIDTLVFGIGRADEMARRRDVEENYFNKLIKLDAKAESFGYYFNSHGQVVDQISTFGISLDHFKRLERLLAVAYGKDKAQAVRSVCKVNSQLTLVTDESCAITIIEKYGGNDD